MNNNELLLQLAEEWEAGTLRPDDTRLAAPEVAKEFQNWQQALMATRWLDGPTELPEALTAFQRQATLRLGENSLLVGNYELLDLIGRGGMGEVFRARHRYLERTVAVKLLLPSRCNHIDHSRFLREAQALAQLDHERIVKVYDAFEHNERFALVTEFVAGQTGAEMARQGRFSLEDIARWGIQAARGLAHAHSRGIVHRDIKPSNLMISSSGGLKILDLGIAKILATEDRPQAALTLSDLVIGTPDYLAPEQFFDARNVDHRADIYSLGATLFHLTTGQAPYPGQSFGETILKHREQPVPKASLLRSGLHTKWDAFFERALAKLPKDRFESMEALEQALSALPVADVDTNRPSIVPAVLSRRTVLSAGALGVAGSVLVGLPAYWYATRRPQGRIRLAITPASALEEIEISMFKTKQEVAVLARDAAKRELLLALPFGTSHLHVRHPDFASAYLKVHVEANQASASTAGLQDLSMQHEGPGGWRITETRDPDSYFFSPADTAWDGWKIDWLAETEQPRNPIVLLPVAGDGTIYVRILQKPEDIVQLQMPNAPRPDRRFIAADPDEQILGEDTIPLRLVHNGATTSLWRMHRAADGNATFESLACPGHFMSPKYKKPHMAMDGTGRVLRTSNPVHAKRVRAS